MVVETALAASTAATAGSGAASTAGGLSFGEMAGLAGLNGALNFGLGGFNTSRANKASKSNAIRNFIMQEYFMNKQNEYNKPINQVRRLREANLNPALLYGSFGGNISASPSGGSLPQTFRNNASVDFLGKLSMALGMAKASADIDKTNAETNAIDLANNIAIGQFGLRSALTTAQIKALSSSDALRRQELAYYDTVDKHMQALIESFGLEYGDSGSAKLFKNIGLPLISIFARSR
ncbi:MAG: DNA pilot protein [Microviridae sp.]|nr:MAG: DNA pilot protein [Microviridae sp.]